MKQLEGNLGRGVIKVSAVSADLRVIEAPARVFSNQSQVKDAFARGDLDRDCLVVVRFQGPKANGMPELHALTPMLSVLLDRGFKVGLVTDGRMSGASGKVPAAIHISPEAAAKGALAQIADGDIIRLDADNGRIDAIGAAFKTRPPQAAPADDTAPFQDNSCSRCFGAMWGRPDAGAPVVLPESMRDATPDRYMAAGDIRPRARGSGVDDRQAGAAEPLADALCSGGLRILEVTLRTENALSVIQAMSSRPGIIVGAGTLLTPEHAAAAKNAGAAFGVSPGSTPALIGACQEIDLPLLPGAVTATEVMRLLDLGFNFLKFFPAEPSGGVAALKALAGPLPHVNFCPTGGISMANAKSYLELANVVCVGGTWVAPASAVESGRWEDIKTAAKDAAALRSAVKQ